MDEDPTWTTVVIGALSAFVLGLFPKLVDAWRMKRGEDRHDDEHDYKQLAAERNQLLKDLRAERETIKRELAAVRVEHTECIERAARQDERILALERECERLVEQIKKLEQRITGHDPAI